MQSSLDTLQLLALLGVGAGVLRIAHCQFLLRGACHCWLGWRRAQQTEHNKHHSLKCLIMVVCFHPTLDGQMAGTPDLQTRKPHAIAIAHGLASAIGDGCVASCFLPETMWRCLSSLCFGRCAARQSRRGALLFVGHMAIAAWCCCRQRCHCVERPGRKMKRPSVLS